MDEVFCLSSGKPAPQDVKTDALRADDCGRAAMETFIKERMVEKSVPFHDPIKRQKLKTFATTSLVKKVKSSDNKLVQIKTERNIFGQLVLLSVENNIDLQVTLSYPLGLVPFSLAYADGMPSKTDKAKLMHSMKVASSLQTNRQRVKLFMCMTAMLPCGHYQNLDPTHLKNWP